MQYVMQVKASLVTDLMRHNPLPLPQAQLLTALLQSLQHGGKGGSAYATAQRSGSDDSGYGRSLPGGAGVGAGGVAYAPHHGQGAAAPSVGGTPEYGSHSYQRGPQDMGAHAYGNSREVLQHEQRMLEHRLNEREQRLALEKTQVRVVRCCTSLFTRSQSSVV